MTIRTTSGLLIGLLMFALLVPAAQATNGMFLTAYGAESAGRGGANLAVSDRTLAINFNPAGIAQLQGKHYSANVSLLAPSLTTSNPINPPTDGQDAVFPLPAFGYVRGGNETPWTWGFGIIAQGGMGAEFQNLNTFFGTQDRTFSEVRFMTVAPTAAYSINEDMAIGATVNLGYGDVVFEFFPETSFFNPVNPQMSFFGLDMQDPASGLQTNLRLGYWWRFHPRASLGVVYQTETNSDFDGGSLVVNFTDHPFLGQKVTYDAEVDGFTFASQAGVGLSFRPSADVVLAVDVKLYDWDEAIDTITVNAKDPSVPGAPPVTVPFVFNWEDQWVYALGIDYRASERLTLRAGYNFGENPVPDGTLNPLFPANVEDHLSIGAGYLNNNKTYNFALEYVPEFEQVNLNPNPMENPFGPGATVQHEQWTLSFGVAWAKARR